MPEQSGSARAGQAGTFRKCGNVGNRVGHTLVEEGRGQCIRYRLLLNPGCVQRHFLLFNTSPPHSVAKYMFYTVYMCVVGGGGGWGGRLSCIGDHTL
jgi:hypothetical protein